ncbi:MAG: DUF4159 domain-containing protein [Chitinophagales bacterium]|nr:DUF4159 domain-containing protein [Chitinophagales bacterium]MCO5281203.1 DUF4159 domain-containing protein [Chitinophagales bacterium]OJV25512.1 MAG: hypothetical protein BGO32_00410 [Bacteroidetes bacterium 37-13]HRN93810.1 DUF4159 domain-containing protein [Chitinophagales bacterium]HRP38098.1 DUF4159 domain-containing protein [Chitinophagales bacterium]
MKYLLIFLFPIIAFAGNDKPLKIALLKYNGGGDWYANPTSLPNLISFANKNLNTNIDTEPETVEVGSPEIFNYPFLHMTGHGNVVFNTVESENLRNYLMAGGFLHADDNYGMDKFIRPQLDKLIPGSKLVELPFNHPIFHQKFNFPNGLPKIHEHDGKPAQAFGLFYQGRLVALYTYECDLGDGWEDADVHKDPEETRQKALRMGANILDYIFGN